MYTSEAIGPRGCSSHIKEATRSGQLRPGQTVIEATRGNTGIELTMVCAAKGYRFVTTMPISVSIERRELLRLLGAEVVVTPKAEKTTGCYLLIPVDSEGEIIAFKMLAQQKGMFTGISGGSTFAVALKIAQNAQLGSVILCMLPDTGERYLSSPLFTDIDADMNETEIAL